MPAKSDPIDLTNSVAGEEDPGASIDVQDRADDGTPATRATPCPQCGGTGRIGASACPACKGTGVVSAGA